MHQYIHAGAKLVTIRSPYIVCDTPLGLKPYGFCPLRCLASTWQTQPWQRELREKKARPSTRERCHHRRLLVSNDYPQILLAHSQFIRYSA